MTNENRRHPIEGRCTCGEVQYRLASGPLFVHCCHCRWCQRETGSAFALNAMIEMDRLELVADCATAEQMQQLDAVKWEMLEEWSRTKRAPRQAAWMHAREFSA